MKRRWVGHRLFGELVKDLFGSESSCLVKGELGTGALELGAYPEALEVGGTHLILEVSATLKFIH